MLLTNTQKETILFKLGHSPTSANDYKGYLDADFFSITVLRIDAIVAELNSIDLLLVNTRTDSMATRLDTVEVDFVQHINHLNITGSSLLKELSNLVGVPIFYNKYTGTSSASNLENNTSSNSFYSYW